MSLGIKSLWRAQRYIVRVRGLSLVPRESHDPLSLQRSRLRRWLSTASRETDTSFLRNGLLTGKPPSSFLRALRRRVIKNRSAFDPKAPALVKRPARYPNKRKSYRSLRKHRRSAARQHVYDSVHEAASRPPHNWHATCRFMMRHCPNVEETLNFRVIIGKGVAREARELLSEPDTHISQISRKNESTVKIEDVHPETGELILSLSGSEDSVRKSLLDIVEIVGKITAVRISDPTWEALLLDVWIGATAKRPGIRLLGNGEVAVDDKTMTVQTSFSNYIKYKNYLLTRRADQIARPSEWSKKTFEEYVAALVHGQVPTHLARSLYPTFPDHQQTVASLLVDLFTSNHIKSAVSVSALKMAIDFLESRGSGFRQASRLIFNQVELLNIPLDAEIFNTFLVSASKAGDLDGFNSILRMMVRKGYPPQSRAWVAFLEMVQSPVAKRYIAAKMRAKSLDRNPFILRAVGRQMAIVDLEHRLSTQFEMKTFLDEQNKKYGVGWLDTITLNRIIDVLGAHGKLDACNDLLNLVHTGRIASSDVIALNTMLTHLKALAPQLVVLQSMSTLRPNVVPDFVTYHLLFRSAWTRRCPNSLRVIWRYAVLAQQTNSKMRYTLTRLLNQEHNLSARRAFLKTWEDVIFGQAELAEMRASHPVGLKAKHFIQKYLEQAKGMKPSVGLATKLEEALSMDRRIHQLAKEGTFVPSSMKGSLTVDIPLEPERKPHVKTRSPRALEDVRRPFHNRNDVSKWQDSKRTMHEGRTC
ncbi:hypothetical protein F5Y06DRAFT_128562 [Hypoxylon sp. FL0890]|nr:hypothetical protein F5Y06DRAFT_128562 [Hypoxylon sp. FL0890]